MTEVFTWQIDGHAIPFLRGDDSVWRPIDAPLRARAWIDQANGYRASISNGRLVKISSRHALPQDALRECAKFFKAQAGT